MFYINLVLSIINYKKGYSSKCLINDTKKYENIYLKIQEDIKKYQKLYFEIMCIFLN